jgi:hypothetical protein
MQLLSQRQFSACPPLREICHSFIKQQGGAGWGLRRQNECEICNNNLQTEELFFIAPSDLPPPPSSPESSGLLNLSAAAMCNKNAKECWNAEAWVAGSMNAVSSGQEELINCCLRRADVISKQSPEPEIKNLQRFSQLLIHVCNPLLLPFSILLSS